MPVLFAVATFLATLAGGLVALRSGDRLHLALGFTGGVLLGLVVFDLLPELFELTDAQLLGVPTVTVALVGGFLALHVVERSLAIHRGHEGEYGDHPHHDPRVGTASALALAAHSFLDGVGIGLAFQIDPRVGVTVAVAVLAHDFADGLNTVGIMISHGHAPGGRPGCCSSTPSHRSPGPPRPCCSPCPRPPWRSTWASSPASCSTWRPATSSPRRTAATRRGSRSCPPWAGWG